MQKGSDMRVFAGIDEAGYGPKFGPLTAGRCVLAVEDGGGGNDALDFWALLREAVCRKPRDPDQRIAVADSKKLTVSGKHGHAAVPHLERAVLTFGGLHEESFAVPADVGSLLEGLGSRHHLRDDLPTWYVPEAHVPWDVLPVATPTIAKRNGHSAESLSLDAGLLRRAARQAGVSAAMSEKCLGVAVLCEDAYNAKLARSASKADVSFTLIAHHLRHVWQRYGQVHPYVVIDRQGGRTRYSATLARALPGASVSIVEEHADASAYELRDQVAGRSMSVRFMPKADDLHLSVALASMTAKYVREIYMARFQRWFTRRLPEIKSTAGYGTDANRFAAEVRPHLASLGIAGDTLIRRA
ncbi:MAG: hypothetical protein AAF328_09685 [Planctomycetota bacterium]